ncbi:MAG: outer membrane beta-barrel protein [Bacteroidota bacterium]|nr:outer membrane beta-barrel protein [Bacteroidota bacterium]
MDTRRHIRITYIVLFGTIIFTCFLPVSAQAQRQRVWHGFRQTYPGAVAVGIAGGGNFNFGLNGPTADCNCEYDNGSGFGYHAGVHLDFFINRWFGLRLQGLFEDHSSSYAKERTAELYRIDGGIEQVSLERRSEVSLQYVSTSFSAVWFTGPGGLYLLTGVGAGFFAEGTLKEEEFITTPGLTFPSTGSSVLLYKDDELSSFGDVGVRASLLFGIGVDFPLGRGAALAPEIQADIPITSVMDGNADWRLPTFRASFALRFGL